jgi:hypothetical protein
MPIKISSIEELNLVEKLDFPIVIPVFNSTTYLKNIKKFFEDRGLKEFLILDMGSTYPKIQEVLNSFSENSVILNLLDNPGPRVFYDNKQIYNWLPETFIATDPDMGMNEDLTFDDIKHLVELSNKNSFFKLGSALNLEIYFDNVIDLPFMFNSRLITIRDIENCYYEHIVSASDDGDLIYAAAIDTTFAVYNKKFDNGRFMDSNYRIAGKYTAEHFGWYSVPPIPAEEYEFYCEAVKGKQYASTETLKRGENYAY